MSQIIWDNAVLYPILTIFWVMQSARWPQWLWARSLVTNYHDTNFVAHATAIQARNSALRKEFVDTTLVITIHLFSLPCQTKGAAFMHVCLKEWHQHDIIAKFAAMSGDVLMWATMSLQTWDIELFTTIFYFIKDQVPDTLSKISAFSSSPQAKPS